jgi:hypothetical protein
LLLSGPHSLAIGFKKFNLQPQQQPEYACTPSVPLYKHFLYMGKSAYILETRPNTVWFTHWSPLYIVATNLGRLPFHGWDKGMFISAYNLARLYNLDYII